MSKQPPPKFRDIRNAFREQSRQTRNRSGYSILNDSARTNIAAHPLERAVEVDEELPAFRGATPAVTTREIRQNRDGSQTAIETVNSGNLKEYNTAMKRHYQNAADARKTMERVHMHNINTNSELAKRQMQYEYANQRDERQHEAEMKRIENSTELTDNQIKLHEAETKITQNWMKFKDKRAQKTQKFINTRRVNQGIRMERKLEHLFEQFDMVKPSRFDYQTPLESDFVELENMLRYKSYVCSKLYHGVSKMNYTNTRREIHFYNGDVIKFPSNVILSNPLTYVVIVHVFSRNMDAIEEDHEQDCPCSECMLY